MKVTGDGFKDHFSPQAAEYCEVSTAISRKLIPVFGSDRPGKELAWDCATGNGQAAVELAEVFERVIATDGSEKQDRERGSARTLNYRVAPAEESGIESNTIDLVTVAQALHWFDLDRFYPEARRVLRPKGVLAAWAYKLAAVSPEIDEAVNHYYSEIVGEYWPAERVLVERFEELPFAFDEIPPPKFEMVAEWKVEQLLGYLRTWSATQRFMAAKQRDPLDSVRKNCERPGEAKSVALFGRWCCELGAPSSFRSVHDIGEMVTAHRRLPHWAMLRSRLRPTTAGSEAARRDSNDASRRIFFVLIS